MTVRNDFLQLLETQKYDWGFRIRETEDDVGLLTVKYGQETVAFYIEKSAVGLCSPANAKDLFDFFNAARNSLAQRAWELWNTRMERFMLRRRVTWKEALRHAGSHQRAELLFALAMVKAGKYGDLEFGTLPPALSQQRDAVNLPRVDKPGYPDRVYLIQIRRRT